jgi:hypothetical protein
MSCRLPTTAPRTPSTRWRCSSRASSCWPTSRARGPPALAAATDRRRGHHDHGAGGLARRDCRPLGRQLAPRRRVLLLEQANTWIWVLALLGTGRACSPAPVRGLGYASEASFPALCCTRPSSSRSPRRGGLGSRRGVEVRDHLPSRACPAPAAVRGPGPPDQRDRFLFGMQPRRPRRVPQRPSPHCPRPPTTSRSLPATPLPRPSTPSWCAWTPPTDGLPGRTGTFQQQKME